jgi:hypothetical protein
MIASNAIGIAVSLSDAPATGRKPAARATHLVMEASAKSSPTGRGAILGSSVRESLATRF